MVEQLLRKGPRHLELVGHGPNGEQEAIELPGSALAALRLLIYHLAQENPVKLVPIQKNMTTYQAADLLNVAHEYLLQLLEQGDIPCHQDNGVRIIRRSDVLAYKRQSDANRAEARRRMIRISEEYGLYEKTLTPPAQWQRLDPDSIVPPTEE